MKDRKRKPTLNQRFDLLEKRLDIFQRVLCNEVKHELILHRWLLGMIMAVGAGLLIALILKALI